MTSCWAALAVALAAEPMPPPFELDYTAPSDCPSKESVVAGVWHLRGPVPVGDDGGPAVRFAAHLEASGARWVARVTTQSTDGAGERLLDADTCDQLAQEVEVVLALALADPAVKAPAPPAGSPLAFQVVAGGGARLGILPDAMPLARVGAGIEWSWLRVALELGLSGSALISGLPAAAQVDSWVQPGLSVCAAPLRTRVRLDACVAVDSAVLTASGRRLAEPASSTTVWVATEVRAHLSAQLWGGLHVFAEIGVGVALRRPRFFVDLGTTTETVYQSPLFNGQAAAGLAWNW